MVRIYNIMACSVPNKYRWTTLKSILLNDHEVGPQSRIFIFAADLRSMPVINRNTYHDLHIIASSFAYIYIRKKYYLCIDYTTIFERMTSNTIVKL